MKRISLLCFITVIIFPATMYSETLTVHNVSPFAGQYKSLQTAQDSASDGDVILLLPSKNAYEGVWITKKLRIVGVGFEKPGDMLEFSKIKGKMYFTTADSSILEGVGGKFDIQIISHGNIIRYCDIDEIILDEGATGTTILGNRLHQIRFRRSPEAIVLNNLFVSEESSSSTFTCYEYSHLCNPTFSIVNNIIVNIDDSNIIANCSQGNYLFANNIFINGTCNKSGYYNNICNGQQLPDCDGNILNIDMNTVFVDFDNGDYHLKSGSPGISSGLNGADMGIYGGDARFVDGGRPGLPLITELNADFVGTIDTGLNVTIGAQSFAP